MKYGWDRYLREKRKKSASWDLWSIMVSSQKNTNFLHTFTLL